MKGLFYSGIILNRGYFFGAFLTFVCSIGVGSLFLCLANSGNDLLGLNQIFVFILPLIPTFILIEFLCRDLERSIKCGFLNYTLSSMTRKAFVLEQLLINLFCMVLGTAMGMAMLGIFTLVGGDIVDKNLFGLLPMITVLGGVVEWLCQPLTLLLKSAEKAGLIVGLILGFGVVLPLMPVFLNNEEYFDIFSLLNINFILIAAAVVLAIYVAVYAINIKLLKRGNIG